MPDMSLRASILCAMKSAQANLHLPRSYDMQLIDFLRFHLFEALIGLVLAIGGAYKAVTYVPLPDDAPFATPVPYGPMFWVIAVSGVAILARAALKWKKSRV
jgi:hypothetical protein